MRSESSTDKACVLYVLLLYIEYKTIIETNVRFELS